MHPAGGRLQHDARTGGEVFWKGIGKGVHGQGACSARPQIGNWKPSPNPHRACVRGHLVTISIVTCITHVSPILLDRKRQLCLSATPPPYVACSRTQCKEHFRTNIRGGLNKCVMAAVIDNYTGVTTGQFLMGNKPQANITACRRLLNGRYGLYRNHTCGPQALPCMISIVVGMPATGGWQLYVCLPLRANLSPIGTPAHP